MKGRPNWRDVLMHPWIPIDLTGEKLQHVVAPDDHFTVNFFPMP